MSLNDMLARDEIERLAATKSEIQELLIKASRRIEEAANSSNYPDTRLELAYNAILFCATAALRADGFRVTRGEGHHHRTLETLRFTVGLADERVDYYQRLRSERNVSLYDRLLEVSDSGLEEAIGEAKELLKETRRWLRGKHPGLVK